MTPVEARQHYRNAIMGIRSIAEMAPSHDVFQQRLREWADRGKGFIMHSFSQYFPPIEAQPDGLIARFDAIAAEINDLCRSGQLTAQKVMEVADEMRRLCYGTY